MCGRSCLASWRLLPGDVNLTIALDRSKTIRQSLADTEKTLIIAVVLVVLVVFAFLRSVRAAAVPSVAVPTSIVGSFGAMYLLGFSLDNLSLMALTISTGFVVDDAIVVLENISRYLEQGMPRLQAAIKGANEVGFTVLSISLSLIAVFAPLIFFGGIVGRLFNEFAVTLSVAVMISLVVSLTTTPMMCALILPREPMARHGRLYRATERVFDTMLDFYRRTLRSALRHPGRVMLTLLATIGLNYYMFRYQMTYGLFPVQDTGLIMGGIQADQSISFQSMKAKFEQLLAIVREDPAVASVVGFTGGRQTNVWFRLHVAEALCAAQGDRRRRREPTSRQSASPRRSPVHVHRIRPEDRRPAEQRSLSVHPALRRHGRPL